jgi:hypothetical protein
MYLQIHEEHNQTLVVTPSNGKKHHAHAKENPPRVAPHSKRPKITKQELRASLSQESKLCYVQMRVKRPQFISFL